MYAIRSYYGTLRLQGGEFLLDAFVLLKGSKLGFEGRLRTADLISIGFHLVNLALDIAIACQCFVDTVV